ncbi:immunity protein YezG family protein [Nocardiopsis flavescens]|uniref:immunity protein YezG family protein n=1 Tax=Nocardiopsis flavescens TaxID=758803 RepID=UPI0036568248
MKEKYSSLYRLFALYLSPGLVQVPAWCRSSGSRREGSISPARQQEILNKVGSKILATAPSDWNKIVYKISSVVEMSSSSATVEYKNGEAGTFRTDAMIGNYLDELRAGMYIEGKGTWFSLECTITHPGRFKVHYNYNDDPELTFATSKAFTNDLEYFPRDPEHTPEWLKQKIREESES